MRSVYVWPNLGINTINCLLNVLLHPTAPYSGTNCSYMSKWPSLEGHPCSYRCSGVSDTRASVATWVTTRAFIATSVIKDPAKWVLFHNIVCFLGTEFNEGEMLITRTVSETTKILHWFSIMIQNKNLWQNKNMTMLLATTNIWFSADSSNSSKNTLELSLLYMNPLVWMSIWNIEWLNINVYNQFHMKLIYIYIYTHTQKPGIMDHDKSFSHCHAEFIRGNIKKHIAISLIPQYLDSAGTWNSSSSKMMTYSCLTVNTMVADVLATQEARASAAIVMS